MTLLRVFRLFTIGAVLALVALMLYAGQPGEAWWWAYALPFAVWIVGPAVVPYLLCRRSPATGFVRLLFAFFLISGAASGVVYHDAFFRSESSTAALALVFVPLCQWAALTGTVLVGIVATRRKPWSG